MAKSSDARRAEQQAAPSTGRVLLPGWIGSLPELAALLGLPRTTLKREARLRRLRVSRRAGRYWTTAAWVLEWLEAGERGSRLGVAGEQASA